MKNTVYFVTHPNVAIDPNTPVPMWPLSELGFSRMRKFLDLPLVNGIKSIYCSTEQKAIDGASIVANHLSLEFQQVEELGENDRSATGYLPAQEFEKVADQFFASPNISIRGWETANAAQNRIFDAVTRIIENSKTPGDIAIISHGGVGSLLLCRLAGIPIDREQDQPGGSGGNFFAFRSDTKELLHGWKTIDP